MAMNLRKSTRAPAMIIAAAAAVAGCNAIFGLQDPEPRDHSSAGTAGMDASVDGASGQAGTAGSSGAGGTGGKAGAGGQAGSSGQGGQSGGGAGGASGEGGSAGGSGDGGSGGDAGFSGAGGASGTGGTSGSGGVGVGGAGGSGGSAGADAGPVCDGGPCYPEVLATGQSYPAALAVDNNYLYWATHETAGKLFRVQLSPLGTPQQLGTTYGEIADIVVGNGRLFWVRDAQSGGLHSSLLDGSDHLDMDTTSNNRGVALDATTVFWASEGDGFVYSKASDNTGSHKAISTAQSPAPTALALDDGNVVWAAEGAAGQSTGVVRAASKDGTGEITLATGQPYPGAIAAYGGYAYWCNRHVVTPTLQKASLADAGAPTTYKTLLSQPLSIAADAAGVVWSLQGGQVKAAMHDGTAEHNVATGQTTPRSIALDGGFVYWATWVPSGTILRAPR
jgi:hypothetical protein